MATSLDKQRVTYGSIVESTITDNPDIAQWARTVDGLDEDPDPEKLIAASEIAAQRYGADEKFGAKCAAGCVLIASGFFGVNDNQNYVVYASCEPDWSYDTAEDATKQAARCAAHHKNVLESELARAAQGLTDTFNAVEQDLSAAQHAFNRAKANL